VPLRTKYKASDLVLHNEAEHEILKYRDNFYLWCRHCLGVTLDPHQQLYGKHYDAHSHCLLIGSRRIRKSFGTAMWLLKEAACKPGSEVNIHAPALEQSKRNIRYMAEAILQSELMQAYIERRLGEGLGMETIRFVNGSVIQAKGQASSTDGLGATHQWLEEFDDMDFETFQTRIYPTGSQLKNDYDYGNAGGCRRIATGTIKGQGNLFRLEHPDKDSDFRFHVLPKLDAWDGIAMGIIPETDIVQAREVLMTPAQFARTYLCLYTESREYFPTKSLQDCTRAGIAPVLPQSGKKYHGAGEVMLGMDFEGHGSKDDASKTAAVFVEKVAEGCYRWLYGKEWPVGTPPSEVRKEVVAMSIFFQISGGVGDAYGASELFEINRALYRAGVCKTNVRSLENKAGKDGWAQWFVRPIRFEGRQKHLMYKRLQGRILAGVFAMPIVIEDHEAYKTLGRFRDQLENVKTGESAVGYDTFVMIRPALGDDLVDAAVAGLWAHAEEGEATKAFGAPARSGGFKGRRRFAPRRYRR